MPHPDLQLHPLHPLTGLCRLITLVVVGWLAACAPAFDPGTQFREDIPARAKVDGVPLIQQAAYYCGPTSLAMVMQWAGADVTPDAIADLAFSPAARGTYLADMIGSSRRLGQLAVRINSFDQLLSEIDASHPVIVFQNLGFGFAPVWHYGVVTGYDFDRDEVYLNSGQREQMVMPFAVFERTWARGEYWGLVVLPPDDLPVSVSQNDILSGGAALERVGQFEAAATLYETGAARWPENWLWSFGLANARYGLGDLHGARDALLQARAIEPMIPEIKANLRQVEQELRG